MLIGADEKGERAMPDTRGPTAEELREHDGEHELEPAELLMLLALEGDDWSER